jgi:hypothetical protein
MKNILRTAKFLPTWDVNQRYFSRLFNWLKCLGGFLRLKPTAGCQISALIFDFFYGGGYISLYFTYCICLEMQIQPQALNSIKVPGNTFDWQPKRSRTLPSLIYFSWDIYRDHPSIIFFSNIKVDIWHPTVGLRCRNPSRHLNQLKTRAIPLT